MLLLEVLIDDGKGNCNSVMMALHVVAEGFPAVRLGARLSSRGWGRLFPRGFEAGCSEPNGLLPGALLNLLPTLDSASKSTLESLLAQLLLQWIAGDRASRSKSYVEGRVNLSVRVRKYKRRSWIGCSRGLHWYVLQFMIGNLYLPLSRSDCDN